MTPKFRAKIENGRIKLYPGEKPYYDQVLQSLEGQNVHVAIGKVKGLRTQQQMKYYWSVVVKLIAEYSRDSSNDGMDEIHEFLKDKFAPRKIVRVKGESRRVAGCTHDLHPDNFFADYIDPIRAWASETLGVVIPDPQRVSV